MANKQTLAELIRERNMLQSLLLRGAMKPTTGTQRRLHTLNELIKQRLAEMEANDGE